MSRNDRLRLQHVIFRKIACGLLKTSFIPSLYCSGKDVLRQSSTYSVPMKSFDHRRCHWRVPHLDIRSWYSTTYLNINPATKNRCKSHHYCSIPPYSMYMSFTLDLLSIKPLSLSRRTLPYKKRSTLNTSPTRLFFYFEVYDIWPAFGNKNVHQNH